VGQGGVFEFFQIIDAELAVKKGDFFGSEAADFQNVE
jgi:hypothetical protein